MKILIVSSTPWNINNSFGNTFCNLFSGLKNVEIANIYCGDSKINAPNVNLKAAFYLNEKMIIKNVFRRQSIGEVIDVNEIKEEKMECNKKYNQDISFFKKHRLQIFFWMRDIIWTLGLWKNNILKNFIDTFKPDLLYLPIYDQNYMCKMQLWVCKYSDIPTIGHITDDIYNFNKNRISPLYWIDKLYRRRLLRKLTKKCKHIDVFAESMKIDYEKKLNVQCNIIAKSLDFEERCPEYKDQNEIVKILYAGNLMPGRLTNVIAIGKSLDLINKNTEKAKLIIYTSTPLSQKNLHLINSIKSIQCMGFASGNEISKIQFNSDILLHTEGFDKKSINEVKMSFSTKIIDYMGVGKCILAVGPPCVESMKRLIDKDAAFCITNINNLKNCLEQIVKSYALRKSFAEKAWINGKIFYNSKILKSEFDKNLKSYTQKIH